jgi:hypothetical protein
MQVRNRLSRRFGLPGQGCSMALGGVSKSFAHRAAWGASASPVPGTADVRATPTAYRAADLVERLHWRFRRRERIAGYVCCTHRPVTDGAILSRTERPELTEPCHTTVRSGRSSAVVDDTGWRSAMWRSNRRVGHQHSAIGSKRRQAGPWHLASLMSQRKPSGWRQ